MYPYIYMFAYVDLHHHITAAHINRSAQIRSDSISSRQVDVNVHGRKWSHQLRSLFRDFEGSPIAWYCSKKFENWVVNFLVNFMLNVYNLHGYLPCLIAGAASRAPFFSEGSWCVRGVFRPDVASTQDRAEDRALSNDIRQGGLLIFCDPRKSVRHTSLHSMEYMIGL